MVYYTVLQRNTIYNTFDICIMFTIINNDFMSICHTFNILVYFLPQYDYETNI